MIRAFNSKFAVYVALNFALMASATSASADVIYTLSDIAGDQAHPGDLGLNFTVNQTIVVDSLGAFTNGNTNITVTLYNLLNNQAVVSTIITTPPISGAYSFQALSTPVTLTPGQYQITAYGYNDANLNYNASPTTGGTIDFSAFDTLNGALTRGGAYYNPTAGNVATTFDGFSNTYGAGNFTASVSAVPLPAALPLFASGLGVMGLLGWWRKRKNATAITTA